MSGAAPPIGPLYSSTVMPQSVQCVGEASATSVVYGLTHMLSPGHSASTVVHRAVPNWRIPAQEQRTGEGMDEGAKPATGGRHGSQLEDR